MGNNVQVWGQISTAKILEKRQYKKTWNNIKLCFYCQYTTSIIPLNKIKLICGADYQAKSFKKCNPPVFQYGIWQLIMVSFH